MQSILIIDSDTNLESLKELLEYGGSRKVFTARNEMEALFCLKDIRDNKIDIILLEPVMGKIHLIDQEAKVDMSEISGVGLYLMNNLKQISKATFVLYTTQSLESLIQAGFPKDISHLRKPESYKEIIKVLEVL